MILRYSDVHVQTNPKMCPQDLMIFKEVYQSRGAVVTCVVHGDEAAVVHPDTAFHLTADYVEGSPRWRIEDACGEVVYQGRDFDELTHAIRESSEAIKIEK